MLKEQFNDILAEFGALVKCDVALDDDGFASFMVDDDMIVNLRFLEASGTIITFAPVGAFGGAGKEGEKALALLRMNDVGGLSEGFTLALDEDADLVLAMDRRSALEIASADSLAAWVEALVRVVRAVRGYFADNFPEEEV